MADQIEIIENQWIALSDGRRLAARLWMPKGDGPFPSILEYLPYRKRDGTAPRDETTHPVFARAGYVCVRVDIAGTGDSDGVFDDEYSEQELSDGEDVLAWIADQGWSDGNVGIIGISWGGFNGLQLASRQPEALKAVISVASTVDRYADDIHFMGGCLLSDNINWSSQMFAYQTRPLDPLLRPDWREEWIERLDKSPFLAADWLAHPTRDAFWKHGSVCEDWSAIKIPVLGMTGWADAYVNAPTALVANLNSASKAMIGPWEHRYAHISKLAPADFHSEVIGWFDRWLKGELNGAEDLPDYRAFMQEHFPPTEHNSPRRGRWIAEQNWPSPNISVRNMYLDTGALVDEPQAGQVTVSTLAHIGQASGYFCPGMRNDNELAGDQQEDDALSVCFDTAPLQDPLELLGRAVFEFSFTVDRPVAQLVARLCDVAPDGQSFRISYRPLNLSAHESFETPEALVPGKTYTAQIELNECAHHLRVGQRLRLALSSSYWPLVWPAPKQAAITLDLAKTKLKLPVRQVATEITPANPGPVQEFPQLETQELRAPTSTSERFIREDGVVVRETRDDFGKTRDPHHGLAVGSDVSLQVSIHPDDPATACFWEKWNFTFERGDWQVEIDTENTMTCDAANFYLHRKVCATEGASKTEILSRDWSKTIPRGLL
ncbi:CocE/NonD family hydrolase [Rhodobacteraceae bacterium M382]|nr:CocE/NonD family hydrolase [Rhodobacteraceae bacterium M382]